MSERLTLSDGGPLTGRGWLALQAERGRAQKRRRRSQRLAGAWLLLDLFI